MRGFDPDLVGRLECNAWVAYYRRRWVAFLRAAVGLVRHTFGFSRPDTLRGAWWVLRAEAMLQSDRWVAEGCDPGSTLIHEECGALIRSYDSLLVAVRGQDPSDALEP